MNAQQAIKIHGQWDERGGFLIWGVKHDGSTVIFQELKKSLFSYHALSFYGHQFEGLTWNNRSCVFLSSYLALDYLAAPRTLIHAHITWSEPMLLLQKVAQMMKSALSHGQYAPDYFRWLNGELRWKLLITDHEMRDFQEAAQTMKQYGFCDPAVWFHLVVVQLLDSHSNIKGSFANITEMYPLLLATTAVSSNNSKTSVTTPLTIEKAQQLCSDEDEFLLAIGWKQDPVPFRTLLQLAEPDEAKESWRLQLVLQDLTDNTRFYPCAMDGIPLEENLPAHWCDQVHDRLVKMKVKWLSIVPELAITLETTNTLGSVRSSILTDEQAWLFLTDQSIRLIEAGHSIILPSWWEQIRNIKPRLRAKIKSSVGSAKQSLVGLQQIVQFDWRMAISDVDLSEAEFQELSQQKKRLVQFRGKWILLDPNSLQQIQKSMKQVQKQKGLSFRDVLEQHFLGNIDETRPLDPDATPHLPTSDPSDGLSAVPVEIELNTHLRRMITQLEQPTALTLIDPPPNLQGILRKYQLEGVSWLLFLRRFGLGACLADDMGLGKTIQWIAYVLQLKETGQLSTPALLVCPTSVIGNWQKELERFAPTLTVHLHYGSNRAKGDAFPPSFANADVVITSYALSHLDEDEMLKVCWSTLCLDEAQNIKNAYTKQSTAIRKLNADHRIALTGTPIENRLTELWSIFDFINPGYLSHLSDFRRKYVNVIERTGATNEINQVQRLVQPFLLRRLKKDPAIQLDLPDKNESKTYVSLTIEQGVLYENVVQDVFNKIDTLSTMERRGLILSALTKLKQICNHPTLFLKTEDKAETKNTSESSLIERSNKLSRLTEMIQELRSEGDRCLIFTQYVRMGNLLQAFLSEQFQESVPFLHGGVTKDKRDSMISRFQDNTLPENEQFNIFILSLKAGGIGLNLTAANHVFHFDRWWNPAVENQATDRAYRIGQTRDVQVHKFITLGTIEERIDDMIERKQNLNDQIIGAGENWITELSTTDLKNLFSLRREWVES